METSWVIREVDLAWSAAIIEGEGSIRINSATHRNLGALIVSVTNTDREIIDWFQSHWPASCNPRLAARTAGRLAMGRRFTARCGFPPGCRAIHQDEAREGEDRPCARVPSAEKLTEQRQPDR